MLVPDSSPTLQITWVWTNRLGGCWGSVGPEATASFLPGGEWVALRTGLQAPVIPPLMHMVIPSSYQILPHRQPHQVILYVTNKWDKHLSHSSGFFYLAELFPWTAGTESTHCTPCFSSHLGRADPQSRPPGWPHMVQWDAAESADTTGSPLPSCLNPSLPPPPAPTPPWACWAFVCQCWFLLGDAQRHAGE